MIETIPEFYSYQLIGTIDLLAYIGPGGGLAAIGTLLAVVVGLMAAVFGFLWYPIKRMLRRKDDATATRKENVT